MRRLLRWFAARAGWLQGLAIVAGLFSAIFWIKSAVVTLPALEMYWGAMPPTAPYQVAVNAAASWNTLAAFSAAVAAGAEALALLLSRFRHVR